MLRELFIAFFENIENRVFLLVTNTFIRHNMDRIWNFLNCIRIHSAKYDSFISRDKIVSWFHLRLIIFDRALEWDSLRGILGAISSSKQISVPSHRGQQIFFKGRRSFKREMISIYSYSRDHLLRQQIN